MTLFFLVMYYISSWHEWKRAEALYGNLTRDAILASLIQICILVQQTNRILDYKQTTTPRSFHKKVHNVAVNPFISKLSLMDVKLALLHFIVYKDLYVGGISASVTPVYKRFLSLPLSQLMWYHVISRDIGKCSAFLYKTILC